MNSACSTGSAEPKEDWDLEDCGEFENPKLPFPSSSSNSASPVVPSERLVTGSVSGKRMCTSNPNQNGGLQPRKRRRPSKFADKPKEIPFISPSPSKFAVNHSWGARHEDSRSRQTTRGFLGPSRICERREPLNPSRPPRQTGWEHHGPSQSQLDTGSQARPRELSPPRRLTSSRRLTPPIHLLPPPTALPVQPQPVQAHPRIYEVPRRAVNDSYKPRVFEVSQQWSTVQQHSSTYLDSRKIPGMLPVPDARLVPLQDSTLHASRFYSPPVPYRPPLIESQHGQRPPMTSQIANRAAPGTPLWSHSTTQPLQPSDPSAQRYVLPHDTLRGGAPVLSNQSSRPLGSPNGWIASSEVNPPRPGSLSAQAAPNTFSSSHNKAPGTLSSQPVPLPSSELSPIAPHHNGVEILSSQPISPSHRKSSSPSCESTTLQSPTSPHYESYVKQPRSPERPPEPPATTFRPAVLPFVQPRLPQQLVPERRVADTTDSTNSSTDSTDSSFQSPPPPPPRPSELPPQTRSTLALPPRVPLPQTPFVLPLPQPVSDIVQPQASSVSSSPQFSSVGSDTDDSGKLQFMLGLDDLCTICSKPPLHSVILKCGHEYCRKCIDKWVEKKSVCAETECTLSLSANDIKLAEDPGSKMTRRAAQRIKKQAVDWLKEQLQPHLKSGQLTRDEFTDIVKRASQKVVESRSYWTHKDVPRFPKHRNKVNRIADAYVKKLSHEKKARERKEKKKEKKKQKDSKKKRHKDKKGKETLRKSVTKTKRERGKKKKQKR